MGGNGCNMKKNWLLVTAGIFYIIASISLLYLSMYCGYALLIGENLFYDYTLSAPDHTLYLLAYIMLIVVAVVKFIMFVMFLVLGIIVIVKAKTFDVKPAKVVTVTMILGYVCAVLDLNLQISNSSTFLLLLTSSIMLSVAISRRGKGNSIEATQSVIDDINSNNETKKDVDTETEIDNLSKQIKSLQALKECGVLSDEDYMNMLKKLVDKTNDEEIDKNEKKEKRIFRVRQVEDNSKDRKEK